MAKSISSAAARLSFSSSAAAFISPEKTILPFLYRMASISRIVAKDCSLHKWDALQRPISGLRAARLSLRSGIALPDTGTDGLVTKNKLQKSVLAAVSPFLSFNSSISPSKKLDVRKFGAVSHSAPVFSSIGCRKIEIRSAVMSCCSAVSHGNEVAELALEDSELDRFAAVANELADAAGDVIRKYFRKSIFIHDKEDLSPVTIADQAAEEAMVRIIQENFPSHAVYGEESGWKCEEKVADFVWVLDPIDGTKSFITGKPLFGTLIALLHEGKPILGIIDQPILKERWLGLSGRKTTLNGQEISTRSCSELSKAYLYTTSPHLFTGDAEVAFASVRDKVKVPLYGCDCYAYALLATGFVDLVIESGLKPYDFLSLIPVIEGAGGTITDWKGRTLNWEASAESQPASFNVVAAGDKHLHPLVISGLQWS